MKFHNYYILNNTSLKYAAMKGNVEIAQILLKQKDINVNFVCNII